MNYSSRFWLYAPITAFLLIAAAVMTLWWFAAGTFEKTLAAMKGREAIPGVTLDWGTVTVGGFPFRLDADFKDFTVKGAGAHGPFAWRSEKFAAHTLTYGRAKTVYEAAGPQSTEWTASDGSTQSANFLPASMRGSSIVGTKGLMRFDLDIIGLGAKDFTAGRFQFHMRRDPDGSDLDLMLKADAVNTRKQIQVYALLNRGDTFAALLRGHESLPDAAARWRAQGGRSKLSQIIAPGLSADALLSPLY